MEYKNYKSYKQVAYKTQKLRELRRSCELLKKKSVKTHIAANMHVKTLQSAILRCRAVFPAQVRRRVKKYSGVHSIFGFWFLVTFGDKVMKT